MLKIPQNHLYNSCSAIKQFPAPVDLVLKPVPPHLFDYVQELMSSQNAFLPDYLSINGWQPDSKDEMLE